MPPRSTIALCFLVGVICSSNGCSSLSPSNGLPFLGDGKSEVDLSQVPSCWVEMRPTSGKAKRIQLPVAQGMRIEQVLDQSKVSFRNMDVFILRQSQENPNQHVKLEIRFDRESGQVKWDTDYAIHPEDRIIIKEEQFTVFDEAYNTILGPVMGRIGRN